MSALEAVILGVVEGITEFLPISSTGHLVLTSSLLGISESEFLKSFNISIQLGAILSVIVLYFRSFLDMEILKRLIVAFIPTGVIGFLAYPFVKSYFLGSETVVLVALFLGGVALIAFELLFREGDETVRSVKAMTYKQAAFIGLFQAAAIVPGVSRSAATVVGGLLTSGLSRTAIVEFSFLLAVPTMLAATAFDFIKSAGSFSGADYGLLAVGFATSFFVAAVAVRWLLAYVRTHTFVAFGIYRVALAAIFFFFAT